MRLETVTIERFRGISHGELSGLVDVNILIGRNNSGKSTVLEAITNLGLCPSQALQSDPLGRNPQSIWIDLRGGEMPVAPRFDPGTIRVSGELWDQGICVRQLAICSDGDILRCTGGEVHDASNEQLVGAAEFMRNTFVFRPEDGRNSSIERSVWTKLLQNRYDKRMVSGLNAIFGSNVESMAMAGDNRLLLLYPDWSLSLDAQGDGARTAVRLLMFLADRVDTLFVIEEPECYQHPGSLMKLARAVCVQARAQRLQILLTTHSIDCVRAFLDGAVAAGSEAAVFHLSLDQGKLESRRLDPDTVHGLLETGLDVRTLDLYV
jgi:uncharacterized protein